MKNTKSHLKAAWLKRTAMLCAFSASTIAIAGPGDLDSRFGVAPDYIGFTQGYVTLEHLAPVSSVVTKMTVDTDQRTLIGQAWYPDSTSTNAQIALRRLDRDGQLDESFGASGNGVASPGHLVNSVAARVYDTDRPSIALTSFRPNVPWSYAGDPTRIYQAVGIGSEIHVFSYRSDGQLDTSFGNRGEGLIALSAPLAPNTGMGMIVTSDAITIVTSTNEQGKSRRFCGNICRMVVARMGLDGQMLDYGNNGVGYYALDEGVGARNRLAAIAANPITGRLYVVGRVQHPGRTDIDLVLGRLDANGYPDRSFGSGVLGVDVVTGEPTGSGFITLGTSDLSEWAYSLAIERSGRVLAAGYEEAPGSDEGTFLNRGTIWAFTANGQRDRAFGNNGKAQILAPPYFYGLSDSTSISNITLDPDGRVLAGGTITRPLPSKMPGEPVFQDQGFVARLDADGHMDFSFGSGWGAGGVSEVTSSASCSVAWSNERILCFGGEQDSPYRLQVYGLQP